jgi:PBP1b-binding outer membrane lipoprotein LpoB
MKRNYIYLLIAVMLVGSLAMFGCAGDKKPAEAAIKAAEDAYAAVKAEAVKYVPEQAKAVEAALASAKDKMAKNDFKAALGEAQPLVGKIKELADAVKAKKDELTKKWESLSSGIPKMIEALESRVGILSKSKKLPANISADKFADAKSGLASAKDEWAKAQESSKAGNTADAASLANSVKEKAAKAMEALGMSVPAAAK